MKASFSSVTNALWPLVEVDAAAFTLSAKLDAATHAAIEL